MIFRDAIDLASSFIARGILAIIARNNGRAPMSVATVRGLSRIGTGPDALVNRFRRPTPGSRLSHPVLAQKLADHLFGTWSLGPATLALLESEVQRNRPDLILEFGSGASTACLAQFMEDVHGPKGRVRVVSLDQDATFAEATRALVKRCGFSTSVVVLAAPLALQTIEGVTSRCYVIPASLATTFQDRRADMIVIDGPAAEDGARFGTLPLARPYVTDHARFYLDDALRDGELGTARDWATLPYVKIDGIRLIDKGVLTGQLVAPRETGI